MDEPTERQDDRERWEQETLRLGITIGWYVSQRLADMRGLAELPEGLHVDIIQAVAHVWTTIEREPDNCWGALDQIHQLEVAAR